MELPPQQALQIAVPATLDLGEAASLRSPDDTLARLLMRLANAGHWPAAFRVVASALPPTSAVAWAEACLLQAPTPPTPLSRDALAAVRAWQAAPTEDARYACYAAALAAGFDTAAACAALTVFLAGPSLAPLDEPALPPGVELSQHAAACTAQQCVVAQPKDAARLYPDLLARALACLT